MWVWKLIEAVSGHTARHTASVKMEGSSKLWTFVILLCYSAGSDATGAYPDQGFFMVANLPEVGKARGFYIYAIHTNRVSGKIRFNEDCPLPPNIPGPLPDDYGCYLNMLPFNSFPGNGYGQYTGTFTPDSGQPETSSYTFVKPPSKVLDTGGVYTVTIYPESTTSNCLAEPVSIGVEWQPGCWKIIWSKGKRRKVNQGPRLKLTSTEDAGLYTIFRPTRGKRGWFVQILVIAASCPEGQYKDAAGDCQDFGPCLNGGVLRDGAADCICPPFFVGDWCGCAVGPSVTADYILGGSGNLKCSDLPGGDSTCKGHLVCYGDNYGCKCSSGWRGNACDKECPKGRYGANCEQTCPDSESDCSRFFGPMTNLQGNGCDPNAAPPS